MLYPDGRLSVLFGPFTDGNPHTIHVDHAVRHDPAWITTNVRRRKKGRRHRAWMEKEWSPEERLITNTYYQPR